jgi:hypothetical protein
MRCRLKPFELGYKSINEMGGWMLENVVEPKDINNQTIRSGMRS